MTSVCLQTETGSVCTGCSASEESLCLTAGGVWPAGSGGDPKVHAILQSLLLARPEAVDWAVS
jgi:hypothetical protein